MQFRLRAKALPLVCLTLLFSSSAALAIPGENLVPIRVGSITIFIPSKHFEDQQLKAEFQYDARGRLIKVKDDAAKTVNYEYDDAGNRRRVTN